MSLRDKIASSHDITAEAVEVPQWDVIVEVRSMSARDRARMVQSSMDAETGSMNFERLYPDLVILCTFDPDTGERAFEESDRDMLLDKNAAAIEIIANAAMRISGIGAKAVEETGKDSSSTLLSEGSTSA